MSIINQMLRDLDARGVAAANSPTARSDVPLKPRRVNRRMVLLVLLLPVVAGAVGYFVLPGTMHGSRKPAAAVASMAQREPVVPLPLPLPLPLPQAQAQAHRQPASAMRPDRAAISAPAPAALKRPVALASRPQAPVSPPLLKQATPAVPVLAKDEPAVVKKMVVLTPEAEAQQYYDEAQALRHAAKPDAAMIKYRLALERNPGMRSARLQLARLLQESGQVDAAMSLLKAGYDRQQDGALAIATGRLLADQGRRDEALTWLSRGRESLRPADWALTGALLSQALRYEEAVNAYQRALASEPGQAGWSLGLGLALEALGRVDEARVAYRKALDSGAFKPDVARFLRQKIDATGL